MKQGVRETVKQQPKLIVNREGHVPTPHSEDSCCLDGTNSYGHPKTDEALVVSAQLL
jgi:hypothetical protein